ncbi:hypothetical protein CTAM01_04578, partial [Colletotrichum tamarilloi]
PGRFAIDVRQLSRHPGFSIRRHFNIARCRLVSPYWKICSGVREQNRGQYNLAKKWFKHRTVAGLTQSATLMTDHSFMRRQASSFEAGKCDPHEFHGVIEGEEAFGPETNRRLLSSGSVNFHRH